MTSETEVVYRGDPKTESLLLSLEKTIRVETEAAHEKAIYHRFGREWSLMDVRRALLGYDYVVDKAMRALLFRGEWKNGKLISFDAVSRALHLAELRKELCWAMESLPDESLLRERLSNCSSMEVAKRSFLFGHLPGIDLIFPWKDTNPLFHEGFAQKTFLSSTPITSWPTFQLPLQFPLGMTSLLPTLVKYMEERDKALHQPPPLIPNPPSVQLLLPF